jgi:hypothetical protein
MGSPEIETEDRFPPAPSLHRAPDVHILAHIDPKLQRWMHLHKLTKETELCTHTILNTIALHGIRK